MRRTLSRTSAPILNTFVRMVTTCAWASSVPFQPQSSETAHQDIGNSREVEPELIGAHRLRADAIGEQMKLLFDAVLHIAACAVEHLIKRLRWPSLGCQRSDYIARVLLALDVFDFGNHASLSAPGSSGGGMKELGEQTRWLFRTLVLGSGLRHLRSNNPPQTFVARHSEYVIHALLLLAPIHQFITAEARVGAQDDPHLGPLAANLLDYALDFTQTACRSINVGLAQAHAQHVRAAEDI